jgi:hypothetical protein
MALQEWRSGTHTPFDAYLIGQEVFRAQHSIIKEILKEFEEKYPLRWSNFVDDACSSALGSHERSSRVVEVPETVMNWGFSW